MNKSLTTLLLAGCLSASSVAAQEVQLPNKFRGEYSQHPGCQHSLMADGQDFSVGKWDCHVVGLEKDEEEGTYFKFKCTIKGTTKPAPDVPPPFEFGRWQLHNEGRMLTIDRGGETFQYNRCLPPWQTEPDESQR